MTDDRDELYEALAGGFGLSADEDGDTCALWNGGADRRRHRGAPRRFGISNIGLSASSMDDLRPLIERLAGS
ncbi:MAG: hypothetical protein R2789_08405 [Microthrixaceae bacterium]